MKINAVKAILIAAMVMLNSCSTEPPHLTYSNVMVSVDERIIPKTGIVNTPLNIVAKSVAPNGCWYNINFIFRKTADFKYELGAFADYENFGSCPEGLVVGDTTIIFTPVSPGDYAIYTWVTESSFEVDTIRVTEPLR